jgi:hypothetical protein
MTIQRLLTTVAAFAACGMMLALVWRDPDPWHGPGQIAIVPLVVGGIGSLVELGRNVRLRRYVFALCFGLAWAGLSAMMAPRAERWTALVIAAVGAVATVLEAWWHAQPGGHA